MRRDHKPHGDSLLLYDNLKSVVLHHLGATVQFNPRFLDFAGHYLFEPAAAPVRYPEAKGKVESLMRYLRQSFFYGRVFTSLDDIRQQAERWRDDLANVRLHGTTRERPADRLIVERARLRALPERADQRTSDDRIETDCESSAACPTVNVRSLALIESGERTGHEDKTNRSVVDVATQQGCDDEAQASRPTASQAKHQCT